MKTRLERRERWVKHLGNIFLLTVTRMVGWLQWADCSGFGSKEVVMMMKVALCRILGARNQSSVG